MPASYHQRIDTSLDARYRARSLWLDALPPIEARPPLEGDVRCDVAIVGAGFTGLWTAYALATLDPSLEIGIVEAEIAGYGASGRNGGFVSAGMAGEARVYRRTHGDVGVRSGERAFIDGIDAIGEIVRTEGIDCGWAKAGSLRIATSPAQWRRLQSGMAAKRARGIDERDMWLVSADEIRRRIAIEGALGGTFTPHCARVDPARLTRGLAEACERRGARVFERSAALHLEPGQVTCRNGRLMARVVLRATESYTTRLPGARRTYLPIYSHMLATEPLRDEVWAALGWSGCETIADQRYLFQYAQRTPDGRIAFGGGGAPYRFASAIRERDESRSRIHQHLERSLRRYFPQLRDVRITHRWGGPFAVPRDWSMGVAFDRATGLGHAGGLSGHGIVGSYLAGHTLADLVLGRSTERTALPWTGHRSPSWEPEPVRLLAATTIAGVLRLADTVEDRTGRTSRLPRLVERWTPGR